MPNQTFIPQIRWLQRNFELISMEEAQRRIRSGVNDRRAGHITFDDGYADNCRTAIPWLVKDRIPCTYFVTVQNILERRPSTTIWRAARTCRRIRSKNSARWPTPASNRGTHLQPHRPRQADRSRRAAQGIGRARQDLRPAIGRPIRYFSFPFGLHANLSCQAFVLAAQCGYEGVCSAYGGYNYPAKTLSTCIASRPSAKCYE